MNAGDGMSCQGVDNANENIPDEPKNGKIQSFFPSGFLTVVCVICGADFQRRRGSPAITCSQPCSRERRLQYGAAYRQSGRDAREKLLAIFGGREPTDEELIALFTPGDAHAQPNLDHASTQRRKPLMTTDENNAAAIRQQKSRAVAHSVARLADKPGMTRISCLRVLFAVPAPPFWREGRQTRTWRTSSKILDGSSRRLTKTDSRVSFRLFVLRPSLRQVTATSCTPGAARLGWAKNDSLHEILCKNRHARRCLRLNFPYFQSTPEMCAR